MISIGRLQQLLLLMVILMVLLIVIPSVMALPPSQIPCFGGEGCPERVNPEDDEYYSVQCTTNAVWIWASIPSQSLVTFVPLFQIDALNDGDSMVAANNVTVIRSGDTITLSGENGNFAPQPGEKSFSWNECVAFNGGLPELPPVGQELTDAQIECMNLTDEQEQVDCLNSLTSESGIVTAQNCEDPSYVAAHIEECFINCRTIVNAIINRAECFGNARSDEIYRFWREYCFGPIEASAIVGVVVAFRRRRKRK